MPEGRAIAAARLRAIMADIAAYLGDCDLTAAAVARRQRVTPRFVHKLFEQEGLVFSRFVLAALGARAPNAYVRLAQRSISSVAFEVGFGDLSYFNRAFRRCYGALRRPRSGDRRKETIGLANRQSHPRGASLPLIFPQIPAPPE